MIRTYTLARAMRDFSMLTLTDGLEFLLSEGFSYTKAEGANALSKHISYSSDYKKSLGSKKGLISLESECILDDRNNQFLQPRVLLDELKGDLLYTSCDCNSFNLDHFSCPHVTALLLAYFRDRDGIDSLKESILAKMVALKTNVEDPFLPGILKKTDTALLGLLEHASATTEVEPIWIRSPKEGVSKSKDNTYPPLSVEIHLAPGGSSLRLELKVGPKRLYVIKKLNQLLEAYQKNSNYAFTPSMNIPAGRDAYDEKGRSVMDLLSSLYATYQRDEHGQDFFDLYSNYRAALLRGANIDYFMEQINHRSLVVSAQGNDCRCMVDLEKEPAPMILEQEAYGVRLRLPEEITLACSASYMYLVQNQTVMRLPASEWDNRNQFTALAGSKQELYIRQSDLPALAKPLNDLNRNSLQLETKGLSLSDYLPEIPQGMIYLDCPQSDMISCLAKLRYERTGLEYNLFDQKTDKDRRNLREERQLAEKLWPIFTSYDQNEMQLYLTCDGDELYDFLVNTMPRLGQLGEVFISDRLKRFRVKSSVDMNVGLQVDAGSLLMSLHSNALDKEEMIELLSAYDRRRTYTRLKNGTFVTIDPLYASTFETLAEAYKAYGKRDPEAMRLPLFRALYMDDMLKDREEITLNQGDSYVDLIRNLHQDSEKSYPLPDSLSQVLRPYQKDGFSWISMLKEHGFAGILADDMGLGKTLQLLSFLLAQKESGKKGDDMRTLVICPASLVYNWKKEVDLYTPALKATVIAGTAGERKRIFAAMGSEEESDVYITSYDLLKRDLSYYEGMHFANQIIDEAQYIKNHGTQAAKSVRLIDSEFRMALTGTPIENRLSELWSIFDYLMPGFLYAYSRFRAEYEVPVINNHDQAVMERLRRMVHPFILRRLKKDVLKDLPDKLEETLTVRMEKKQRAIYDAYAERLRLYLDKQSDEDFHQNKLEILAELTKLRQICCGPELFLDNYDGGNAKLDACVDLVGRAIDGGHKILLFSQYTSVLDQLQKAFKKSKIASHRIDGSVSKEKRMELVEAFQTDEVPVFLISLKAGGTGLNLTAADIVIHYDPWWNVAAQNQATDRAHRIGQTNAVTVYQLIVEKTIEEQIVLLQQAKAKLAEDLLAGEGIASIMIHKEDLLALL